MSEKARPNILLFLTDEHRLSGVGCYGPTPCRTPVIDSLAANGVRFENAYTTCPLCSPARASVITGLYPHANGITSNIHELCNKIDEMPDSPYLLPRQLASAGYRCGYNGKWHLGTDFGSAHVLSRWMDLPLDKSLPSSRGFEGYDYPGHGGVGYGYPAFKEYLRERGFSPKVLPHAEDGEKITGFGILEGPVEASVPYFLAEKTIELIDRLADSGQPFFLWHNDWGPHGEHWAPREYYERYRDIEIPEWPNFRWNAPDDHPCRIKTVPNAENFSWEDWAEVIRHYYACASLIDEQFGRIMKHLKRRGLADNTVTIISSDHGETLGSHGGLSDKGFSHFEEIQRIPMILNDPRCGSAGKVRNELVSLVDICPTILDYAGVPDDCGRYHGRSLRPLVEGESVEWRDSVFVEFHGLGNVPTMMITCRHANLKYGWTATGRDELYDLLDDPHEMKNILGEGAYSEELRMMRRRVYSFLRESGHPAADVFLRTRLGWNIDRQYLNSPDPLAPESFMLDRCSPKDKCHSW